MKKVMEKTAALMLAAVVAIGGLTGCSTKMEDYASTVVANYGDTPIYLDEANFMARYNQWFNELYYMSYFGESMWAQEYGGKTMEAGTKEDVMAAIYQTEVLLSHAEEYGVSLTDADMEKVNQACDDFFGQIDEKMIEVSGATEELAQEVFSKNALANKVWQAVTADVDTNVPDEEAQQVGIRYVLIRYDNEAVEDPEATANEIVSRVQAGEDMEAVAEEMDLYCGTNNYTKHEETDDIIGSAAISMKEGEVRAVVDETVGWYALLLETEYDEEATANKVQSIIVQRKAALFQEVYAGWEKLPFTVDEDIWDEIEFDGNPVYEMPEVTTPAETEAAAETTEAPAETTETAQTTAPVQTEAQTETAAE